MVVWKIYKYIFPNGKCYIGQTRRTIRKRFNDHNKKNHKIIVNNAIHKYGKNNIHIKTLDLTYSQDEADRVEDGYIMMFGTLHPSGYNMQRGGQRARNTGICALTKLKFSRRTGRIVSDETRKKLSISHSGVKNGFYGKKHTSHTKNLISVKKKGVPNLLKRKVDPKDIENTKNMFKTQQEQADYFGTSRTPIYVYLKKNGQIKTRNRRSEQEIQNALDLSYDPI